jgi:hypothetical protein
MRTWRGGWRATSGKPVLRSGFVTLSAALIGALVLSWVAPSNYEPIHRGERGTLGEGIAAVRRAPTGRASLVPLDDARARGDLGSAEVAPPTASTPDEESTAATSTTIQRRVGSSDIDSDSTDTTVRRRVTTTVDETDTTEVNP